MSPTSRVDMEGGDAFDRARAALDAADIDSESVTRVEVIVEHGEDGPEAMEGLLGQPLSAPDPRTGDDEAEIEYGPTEPSREGHTKGGGGRYKGQLPHDLFEGEAIRPDSVQGRVLADLADDGGWKITSDVAEDIGINPQRASDAVSVLFNKHGWIDRREADPQPSKKGLQREYRTNEAGRGAISEGRRRAEKYYEQQSEGMED